MYFYFMGTWLNARFTHAACEKAEKWIKDKIRCRKHSLPIAFLSCVCWGTKLAARLSTWVTSVSSTGRLNREDQFQGHTERRRRMCTFLHFSRLLFAQLSGLLQCQTPRHCRHPSSPLSTKLFRHLACWSFKVFVARLLHCTRPPRAFSKRQGEKKTLKLPTLQILVCAVVTHSLLSVTVCLGLAIFCVL